MPGDEGGGGPVAALVGGRGPVLVVAAHPDDETIGAGGILPRIRAPSLLYLTDGAPRERRWWGDPSPPSRRAYAALRRRELASALALAGVGPERVRALPVADQEASADLAALARAVLAALRDVRPAVVLTHPYEGGHPDHDAAAFAVRAAVDLLGRGSRADAPPRIVELTGYHASPPGLAVGGFLPVAPEAADASASPEEVVELDAEARERKRAMLACFASQAETLRPFGTERERFRWAPRYDFGRAPHGGALHYERFAWGVTGPQWRARAAAAREALGLGRRADGPMREEVAP